MDYDTWKTTTPDDDYIDECPICDPYSDKECEHTQQEIKEYYEDMKTDYLIHQEEERAMQEDLNAEIKW
jgi:hypothetical protein